MEKEIRLIKENRDYLKWLEIFNERTAELGDRFLEFQTLFIPWLKILKNDFEKFSGESVKETNSFDLIGEYTSLLELFSKKIREKMKKNIPETFSTAQVATARNLFMFFQSVNNIYYIYQPNLNPDLIFPKSNLNSSIQQSFPKFIEFLSEKLELSPAELSSLALLPPSFPSFSLAFAELLGALSEIEKTKTFEAAALISQCDQKDIQVYCPSPQFVAQMEDFSKIKKLKETLTEKINFLVERNKEKQKQLIKMYEGDVQVLASLSHILTFEGPQITTATINIYQAFVRSQVQKHEEAFLLQLQRDIGEQKDFGIVKNFLKLETELLSAYSPDIELIYEEIVKIKRIVLEENLRLKEELYKKKRKIEKNMKIEHTKKEKNTHFEERIHELGKKMREHYNLMLEAVGNIMEIDIPLKEIFNCDEILADPSFYDSLFVNESVKKWWESVEDFIKLKRGEKINEILQTTEEIDAVQKRTDELRRMAEALKKKENKEVPICESCEINRAFVIKTCGHSFCEKCMREQLSSNPSVCKYCTKPFTKEDVIQISW